MSSGVRKLVIPLIGLICLVLFPFPSAAAAQVAASACDTVVTDDAGVLGSRIGEVEVAAEALRESGAEVRVVTAEVSADTTVDDYMFAFMESCPNLQGRDDLFSPSLVLFMITFGGNGLLFDYGSQFDPMFVGRYSQTSVQAVMLDGAQSGDFVRSLTDGMELANAGIVAYTQPPPEVSTEASPQPARSPAVDAPAAPSGPSSAPRVVFIIVVAIVLLVLIGLAVWYFSDRRAKNEERRTVRQRALSARDATTTITNNLDDARKAVFAAKVRKYSAVGDQSAERLRDLQDEMNASLRSAIDAVASAAVDGSDADRSDLTTGEYNQLAGRYEVALQHARAAQSQAEAIEQQCDEIDQALSTAETSMARIATKSRELDASIAALEAEGIRVNHIRALIQEANDAYESMPGRLRDLSVLATIAEAEDLLSQADAALVRLAEWRSHLEKGVPALSSGISAIRATTVGKAEASFERIAAEFAEACWEPVAGNGTEADNRIADAEEALIAVRSFLENQQWERAISALEEGEALLQEAVVLLHSFHALERMLEEARQSVDPEIEAAATDIENAERYLVEHASDVDAGLSESLAAAVEQLAEARRGLECEKPDYPRVLRLALAANRGADDVYEEAAEDVDIAERRRRQADAAYREANVAIGRAYEYIRNHERDVGGGARSDLGRAKQLLLQSDHASDPADVIDFAERAEAKANSAYASARRDFRRAEDARTPVYTDVDDDFGVGFGTSFSVGSSIGSRRHSTNTSWGVPSSFGGGGRRSGSRSHGGGISFKSGGGRRSHGGGIRF